MKFVTIAATAALVASSASALNVFGSSPAVAPNDDGSLSVPGANPLQHCQDPTDDILTLKSVDLNPNPPKAGKTLSINAKGVLSKDVEEGAKVHLQVKYGLITIIRTDADLCENVKNVDLECPLPKDQETELSKEVELPKEIPSGKYTVLADVISKDDEKITCLTATVEFKKNDGAEQIVINKEWL